MTDQHKTVYGYKQYVRVMAWGLIAFYILSALSLPAAATPFGKLARPTVAPEFTHRQPTEWLNSEPLKLSELRGKVVLIDFWTFDCWNCYRSFPWLRSVEQRFDGDAFQIIGVHSPEFDHERDIDNVRRKSAEFELHHPIMIDNDFSYWRAMRNKYWPAYYVIDKRGNIRGVFVGEIHKGSRRASAIEGLLKELLAQS